MSVQRQKGSKTALITGATGFVGAHLCEKLAGDGWGVVAAARKLPTRPAPPGVVDRSLFLFSDSSAWQDAMASVACVVHLAAHVHRMGRGADRDPEFRRINVEGSRFVAEQAARAGVARFLFLSSLKVNGEGGAARAYRFDDPPNPLDLYAVSKLEAENVLRDVCLRNGMKLTIIRAPLIYGPGVGGNFHRLLHLASTGLPLPLRAIDNRRSLIGIWNLTNFMELCMDPASEAEGTWLISDGDDQSTPQLIEKLARLMSRKTRLFSVPPAWLGGLAKTVGFGREMSRLCESLRADITPARDLLAWNAPMSVDEGLSRTVSAYRAGTEHAPG